MCPKQLLSSTTTVPCRYVTQHIVAYVSGCLSTLRHGIGRQYSPAQVSKMAGLANLIEHAGIHCNDLNQDVVLIGQHPRTQSLC